MRSTTCRTLYVLTTSEKIDATGASAHSAHDKQQSEENASAMFQPWNRVRPRKFAEFVANSTLDDNEADSRRSPPRWRQVSAELDHCVLHDEAVVTFVGNVMSKISAAGSPCSPPFGTRYNRKRSKVQSPAAAPLVS